MARSVRRSQGFLTGGLTGRMIRGLPIVEAGRGVFPAKHGGSCWGALDTDGV